MERLERFQGCLLAGAAGDALGYAVEFLHLEQILRRFGEAGIRDYCLYRGVAEISDDTQMTLFTANGLLLGAGEGLKRGGYPHYIGLCYRDWLKTQNEGEGKPTKGENAWLNEIPAMNHSRAPGVTCMGALMQEKLGSVCAAINSSKGCGGVMRVAPIGLFFDGKKLPLEEIDRLGAEAAALTHGHELGYIPAAALVHMIHRLVYGEFSLFDAAKDALDAMERCFPKAEKLGYFQSLMEKAMALAREDLADPEAIRELGEGWVAEETLAIALYCALKYEDDMEKALIAAVNHSGDSDSTGAVTGNLLGASLGIRGIPEKFLRDLELKDVILEVAEDLYRESISADSAHRDREWTRKYGERSASL